MHAGAGAGAIGTRHGTLALEKKSVGRGWQVPRWPQRRRRGWLPPPYNPFPIF